jgi:hypothetical protein
MARRTDVQADRSIGPSRITAQRRWVIAAGLSYRRMFGTFAGRRRTFDPTRDPCRAPILDSSARPPGSGGEVKEAATMRRKTFDALLTTGGVVLAVVLLVAGGLLTWGHSFVDNQVRTQLSQQKIFFPEKGSPALASPEIGPYLNQYAGQQLLTGAQAETYANHFIAVHLNEISGGQTYAQLSAKAMANPADQKLAGQVATVFRGETLRGLLLNAYAFGTMGTIAGIAALVSFAGAAVLLLLSGLGLWHLRRTPAAAEVLPRLGAHQPAPVER